MDWIDAEILVSFIAQHIWHEFEPRGMNMDEPYALLALIQERANVDSQTLDLWMQEAQKELAECGNS